MLFQRNDWTLFRSLDTLGQKAGVPKERLGAIVVKELVDNALDAGSSKIDLGMLGGHTFFVEDDGEGLPGTDTQVAEIFSISRPLTSSKLLRLPTRGALGNGLRVVAGAVLATKGRLIVRTRGRSLLLTPQFHNGQTLFEQIEHIGGNSGTRIEISLPPPLKIDFSLGELALSMRGEKGYSGKTNVHWYSTAAFRELVSAAPQDAKVGDLLAKFDVPRTKTPAISEVRSIKIRDLSDPQVTSLFMALRGSVAAPTPQKLGLVGPTAGPYEAYARKVGTYDHSDATLPCVVEVWAQRTDGYGDVRVLVNRTPVVSQVRHRTSKDGTKAKGVLVGCGLNHWTQTGKYAYDAVVNIQTPYMAVTNDGKEPDLKPLYLLIAEAFEKASRIAKRLNPATREARARGEKPQSKKDAIALALDRGVTKASGGGRYRYSLRQLYYAVRPIVGTDLEYNYFSSVVADIESERGRDLPGIYRDARGVLYHPHTGESISLGTRAVEEYQRPKLTFNKILYIEKGGFFPLLIDNKWPERHDCALVTSQGFASKAAKDVLDLLGDGDEEIEFFCVHDADGPGTLIYEALQEASRARPARRVKIINLGLEPSEGRRMGLEVEEFERKKGKVPAANYVTTSEREWLQDHRIELNAMTSPQFLQWLTDKFEAHATVAQKVVPDKTVLRHQAENHARAALRKRMVDKVLAEREVEIQAQVDAEIDRLDLDLSTDDVGEVLREKPAQSWRQAVTGLVSVQINERPRRISPEASVLMDLHIAGKKPEPEVRSMEGRPQCPHGSYNLAHCMSEEEAMKLGGNWRDILKS